MALTLGELVVELAADNAKLNQKLGETEEKLKNFEKSASGVSDKVKNSISRFTIAASAALIGLGYVVQSTINAAEALGQKSQSLGLAADELGKLQFAATQTNIEVEGLNQSLTLLSRAMGDREAGSEGVRTFDALGISVRNASGELKSSGAVFLELADKFSHMKDGAAKTQLAVSLLGRAGAQMVPLLNQGSQAIKEMGDQGVALGAVFDGELIERSSTFNDTLDTLGAMLTGLANNLTKQMLPVLQYLATSLAENKTLQEALAKTVDILAISFKTLVATGLIVVEAIKSIAKAVWTAGTALVEFVQGDWAKAVDTIKAGGADIANDWGQLSTDLQTNFGEWAPIVNKAAEDYKKATVPIIKTTEEMGQAFKELQLQHQYAFQDLMNMNTVDPVAKIEALNQMVRAGAISWREYDAAVRQVNESIAADTFQDLMSNATQNATSKVAKLRDMVDQGSISWRQYDQAVKEVNDGTKQNMENLVSSVATALTTIFGKSKSAAIAAAVINTLQGITKALAELPPPYSYAAAAVTAAMGAAQIAKIRSTSQSGGGASPSAPSSAGAGAARASAPQSGSGAAAPAAATQGQTLTVAGISASGFFSGDVVRDLAQKLIDYQRDGGKVVLAPS